MDDSPATPPKKAQLPHILIDICCAKAQCCIKWKSARRNAAEHDGASFWHTEGTGRTEQMKHSKQTDESQTKHAREGICVQRP